MLKQIGGYMPRMWEGRCKPCSLRSAVCSVPPMSRGCRAHIATPGTVGVSSRPMWRILSECGGVVAGLLLYLAVMMCRC